MRHHDAIVIGTGQYGPTLARRLVAAGQKVDVIERKFFGGTCVRIFINVGGRASIPPIPGLDEVPYFTNSSMMDVDFLPSHLIILGGRGRHPRALRQQGVQGRGWRRGGV